MTDQNARVRLQLVLVGGVLFLGAGACNEIISEVSPPACEGVWKQYPECKSMEPVGKCYCGCSPAMSVNEPACGGTAATNPSCSQPVQNPPFVTMSDPLSIAPYNPDPGQPATLAWAYHNSMKGVLKTPSALGNPPPTLRVWEVGVGDSFPAPQVTAEVPWRELQPCEDQPMTFFLDEGLLPLRAGERPATFSIQIYNLPLSAGDVTIGVNVAW